MKKKYTFDIEILDETLSKYVDELVFNVCRSFNTSRTILRDFNITNLKEG